MSIIKKLENDIKDILKTAGYEVDRVLLEPSNRRDLGEYQINNAMQLAKTYHENPRDIATKIVNELEKDNRFTNINTAGPGFINITLSDQYTCDFLNEVHEDVHNNIDKKEPKIVVVDYGGANVAKALHVGHLRTGNIGEALKRLALLLGYDALGDAHLGDYGRPLGLVLREIKERYPDLEYFNEDYTGDYSEIDLPITNKDLEEIYPVASNKAKEDEQYLDEARDITARIQSHERGYYDLWKRVVDISKEDIKKTYESLNVYFEIWNGESDEMEYFDELKKIYEDKNLLKESEGAQVVDVATPEDKAPMPPLIFTRSNGVASYETTDLAAILERKINYNPDEIWYVVDARQALHFEQTFRAARKAELVEDRVVLEHVGNGTMNGKDGKPFKTRDGGVMSLKALMDLVYDEKYKKITNESIKEEEKKEIARIVAVAAVKYADLLPYRGTDYIFELEKFTDLEGKTGPYLLYSTIRMRSLLKKAGDHKATKITKLKGAAEKEIALTILNLPLVLNRAVEAKTLNEIAEFLYKLTACYNSFYAENKIITEEDSELRDSWILLTETVYNINMLLLGILGIEVPEKM